LSDGHRVAVGSMALTRRAVEHGMPAFALRVEAGGRSLVYSGDTAPCVALTELAADCDLLLCEAEGDDPAHHTPEQAGATATAAAARRLVVTHVGRAVTPERAVTRAAAHFAGPVESADPGATFTV
jgi:ribonuclease BN (tRNA processing enzyme)